MPADVVEVGEWLARLVGLTVEVARRDGSVLVGSLVEHPTDPEAYEVRDLVTGAPATLWPDEVLEVRAA
jgi:hypothetical protein